MAFPSNRSHRSARIARFVGEDVDLVRGALRSRAGKLKALCDRAEARDAFNKQADLAKAKLGGAVDKAKAVGDLEALNRRAELARSKFCGAYDRAKVICERSEALEALSRQAGLARCRLEGVGGRVKQLHSSYLSSRGSETTGEATAGMQPHSQGLARAMKEQVVHTVQSARTSSRVVADKLLDGRQSVERALQTLRPESRMPTSVDVEATATFQGSRNGAYDTAVARGTHGTVLSVDVFGHALVRFGSQDVWVYPSQFKHLRVVTCAQPASDWGSGSEDSMAEEEMRDLCQQYPGALHAATLDGASTSKAGHRSDASTTSSVSSDFDSEEGEHAEEDSELPPDDSDLAATLVGAARHVALQQWLSKACTASDPEPTAAVTLPWQCRPSTATWLMPAPIG